MANDRTPEELEKLWIEKGKELLEEDPERFMRLLEEIERYAKLRKLRERPDGEEKA